MGFGWLIQPLLAKGFSQYSNVEGLLRGEAPVAILECLHSVVLIG